MKSLQICQNMQRLGKDGRVKSVLVLVIGFICVPIFLLLINNSNMSFFGSFGRIKIPNLLEQNTHLLSSEEMEGRLKLDFTPLVIRGKGFIPHFTTNFLMYFFNLVFFFVAICLICFFIFHQYLYLVIF